jgi:hypothetical protein
VNEVHKAVKGNAAYQKLLLLFLCWLVVESLSLYNFLIYDKLEVSALILCFFDTLFSNESCSLGLTATVRAALRLQISTRIPDCQSIKPKVGIKK